MVNVPQFTMGGRIRDDWMQGSQGIVNALGQWRQREMQNRQLDTQDKRYAQQDKQWNASNALAQAQFGLAQRTADRADALAPGQLELQKAQLSHAIAQGASERALAPLMLQIKQSEAALAQAKAQGKDAETVMMRDLFGGGQPAPAPVQPQPARPPISGNPPPPPSSYNPDRRGYADDPNVRPQSYNEAPPLNVLAPQPVQYSEAPADPNVILTQGAAPQPQAPAQPTPRDLIQNMTPAQRAQFGMAWMGKGEAAKVLGTAADAEKLSKETRNKIDEQEMKAVNGLGRLKQIASGYKDEWLTWEGQWKQYGAALLDKSSTLRAKMKPEQVAALEEYTAFQRDAYENLTQGITDATGAAMGVDEEKRIRRGLPDPDKDSPTQFKSKLMGSMNAYELSIQRTQFLRQNGFKGDANSAAARMPIDRFRGLLNESRSLYQKMKTENPGADDAAIRDTVRQTIVRKYGISA